MPDANPERDALYERGIAAFGSTLATLDPIRFRAWAELGLTITQLRALVVIKECPGITVSQLAARFEVTPPSITGLIDRLVAQSYITREDDSSDRRRVRHALTEYGAACLDRIAGDADRHFYRVFDQMTDDELAAFVRAHEAFLRAHVDVGGELLATPSLPGN